MTKLISFKTAEARTHFLLILSAERLQPFARAASAAECEGPIEQFDDVLFMTRLAPR